MHNACSFGHADVVSILIESGADPNARDNWNFTPLHEAAIKGKVEVCISKSTTKSYAEFIFNFLLIGFESCRFNNVCMFV